VLGPLSQCGAGEGPPRHLQTAGAWHHRPPHPLPPTQVLYKRRWYPHLPKFFFSNQPGRVFVHPRSVNFEESEFSSPWLVYSEKVSTNKVWIRMCSEAPPFPLLLFSGPLHVAHQHKVISLDSWIQFRADPRIAVLIKVLLPNSVFQVMTNILLERNCALNSISSYTKR